MTLIGIRPKNLLAPLNYTDFSNWVVTADHSSLTKPVRVPISKLISTILGSVVAVYPPVAIDVASGLTKEENIISIGLATTTTPGAMPPLPIIAEGEPPKFLNSDLEWIEVIVAANDVEFTNLTLDEIHFNEGLTELIVKQLDSCLYFDAPIQQGLTSPSYKITSIAKGVVSPANSFDHLVTLIINDILYEFPCKQVST